LFSNVLVQSAITSHRWRYCMSRLMLWKSLGIIFQQRLSFELHIQSVLRQCSQILYLLKNVTYTYKSSYTPEKLHFYRYCRGTFIVCYMPAWETRLNVHSSVGSLWGSSCSQLYSCYTVQQPIFSRSKMHNPLHCLHRLLPPVKTVHYSLQNSQQFILPQCKYLVSILNIDFVVSIGSVFVCILFRILIKLSLSLFWQDTSQKHSPIT